MTVTEKLLMEAAERIMQGWCQNTPARTADGKAVYERAPEATYFCALGAIHSFASRAGGRAHKRARDLLVRYESPGICSFNDDVASSKEQVAQLLCEAAGL